MNAPSVAPMPVTRQAPPEPDPRDERDLQLTVCVDEATNLALTARHYDAGGCGLGQNVVGVSAQERAEVRALASRFVASVRPSAREDVQSAMLAELRVSVKLEIDAFWREEMHSQKRVTLLEALQKFGAALVTPATVAGLIGAQNGVLDARIVRAVRYPFAIRVGNVTALLDQDERGFYWVDLAPACENEACLAFLSVDGEMESRPSIVNDELAGPLVACDACGSQYEIGPAVVRERSAR